MTGLTWSMACVIGRGSDAWPDTRARQRSAHAAKAGRVGDSDRAASPSTAEGNARKHVVKSTFCGRLPG